MTHPTPPCCEAWPAWADDAAWYALQDEPAVLVMPHLSGTFHQINYCPSCGADRRSATSTPFPPVHPHPSPTMTIDPSADRFRVGDVWRSPRMKDWQCDKVENGLARLRSLRNPKNTQWRGVFDTGRDMSNAWQRITPPPNHD